jgi:hypothetical protein
MAADQYEPPKIIDHGTLQALTEAIAIVGAEDGASKIDTDNHHSLAVRP